MDGNRRWEAGEAVWDVDVLHFKKLQRCRFLLLFLFFVELQENILQRYHAEIVDLIKKTTGETEHRSSVFCLPSFLCGKTGGCRCQTCDSLWPQHQIRNWQIQWEGDQGAHFEKTVSCWTGVTNNCSNNCRVEPKFNLLEAKCVFVFDVRSQFFLDLIVPWWQGWSTMTTPSQVACSKKRDVWAYCFAEVPMLGFYGSPSAKTEPQVVPCAMNNCLNLLKSTTASRRRAWSRPSQRRGVVSCWVVFAGPKLFGFLLLTSTSFRPYFLHMNLQSWQEVYEVPLLQKSKTLRRPTSNLLACTWVIDHLSSGQNCGLELHIDEGDLIREPW